MIRFDPRFRRWRRRARRRAIAAIRDNDSIKFHGGYHQFAAEVLRAMPFSVYQRGVTGRVSPRELRRMSRWSLAMRYCPFYRRVAASLA